MTLKANIRSVIDTVATANNYDWFYGVSKGKEVPYIRFFLGNNFTRRLSNKKAIRNIWYQLDVFSYTPIDVQDADSILNKIESKLEDKNLITTDWMENFSEDNNTQYTIYHYFIEVRE